MIPLMALAFLLGTLLLVHADGEGTPFQDFFQTSLQKMNDQGSQFWNANGALANTVPGTFVSVYQAFMPASCDMSLPGISPAGARIQNSPSALPEWTAILLMWLEPTVFTAIIISMALAAIYMISQLLSSQPLSQLAKDEAFQLVLTLVRVLFVGMGILAGETFFSLATHGSSDLIYSNPANVYMIDSAMAFSRMMLSDISTHYSMLILYNMVLHTVYSSTMWFGVTWRAMYSFNLGPVLKPLIDVVGTSLQFLSLGMSEWLLHIVTLCLIKKWVFVLFIPLSMILRAIPYTRSAGEALFALSFALYLFYPFMFLIDYEVHKIMRYNITDAQSAMSSFINKSGIMSVFGSVLVVMFLMAGVFMPFFLGGALTLAFELIRGAVYYVVIISILLPALNIFITLTAARETARFFNVDVNFMAFLKVI